LRAARLREARLRAAARLREARLRAAVRLREARPRALREARLRAALRLREARPRAAREARPRAAREPRPRVAARLREARLRGARRRGDDEAALSAEAAAWREEVAEDATPLTTSTTRNPIPASNARRAAANSVGGGRANARSLRIDLRHGAFISAGAFLGFRSQ